MNNPKELPEYFCERCGEKLDPERMVWLELSWKTGLFTDPGVVNLGGDESVGGESQGGFAFGRACAKAVLKNGGKCVRINTGIRTGRRS